MDQLTEILRRLHDAKVEFSLIGGFASRYYGVTLVTEDVDVCARFNPENLRRIESAMKEFNPIHRLAANKLPLELTDDLCSRLKNLYLRTDIGVLDCLSEVAGIGDFDAVLKHSQKVSFPFGHCYILKIEALIQAKQAVGRQQDLLAVQQLSAINKRLKQQPELKFGS
ncbi:MAG TPA: hypothetical protein VH597_17180 [Verrucomicrobiae bacterium]|jgi:hypothetical protein|nr:hypothetical protein [Verrucomicrobiae bacterium]